jgi:hypothetical protein
VSFDHRAFGIQEFTSRDEVEDYILNVQHTPVQHVLHGIQPHAHHILAFYNPKVSMRVRVSGALCPDSNLMCRNHAITQSPSHAVT